MDTSTHVTERQIRILLGREIERAKGVRALAREWGICPSIISRTANGRRKPGPAILSRFEIRATTKVTRRVVYTAAQ